MNVTVLIENAYSDGHESSREVELPAPGGLKGDTWWDEVVWDETGDGHGIDSDLGSCYTATIITAPHDPTLVGQSHEWVG